MKEATKRSIVRWIHILFAIPIIGYIYSPFKELPNYAPVVRYIAFPLIAVSGLVDVERPSPPTAFFEKVYTTGCNTVTAITPGNGHTDCVVVCVTQLPATVVSYALTRTSYSERANHSASNDHRKVSL